MALHAVDAGHVAELDGAEVALAMLDGLPLGDYRYFHSTRAELLRRLGRADGAREAYRRAPALTSSAAERELIEGRVRET